MNSKNTVKQTTWVIPLMVVLSNMPLNAAAVASNRYSISISTSSATPHFEVSKSSVRLESVVNGEEQLASRAVPIRWS